MTKSVTKCPVSYQVKNKFTCAIKLLSTSSRIISTWLKKKRRLEFSLYNLKTHIDSIVFFFLFLIFWQHFVNLLVLKINNEKKKISKLCNWNEAIKLFSLQASSYVFIQLQNSSIELKRRKKIRLSVNYIMLLNEQFRFFFLFFFVN